MPDQSRPAKRATYWYDRTRLCSGPSATHSASKPMISASGVGSPNNALFCEVTPRFVLKGLVDLQSAASCLMPQVVVSALLGGQIARAREEPGVYLDMCLLHGGLGVS